MRRVDPGMPMNRAHSHPESVADGRAFTLVELLVVVGIIALLVGLLLPVLGQARQGARQAMALSDVRQLGAGYALYHNENQGRLLLGFPPRQVNGVELKVTTQSGHTLDWLAAERYPWRLAGYVPGIWPILHSHNGLPPMPEAGDSDSEAFAKAYNLSVGPSFGLNSVYLGGHKDYGGFVAIGSANGIANHRPNTGRHVAFKVTEVREPTRQIVFAEVQSKPGTPGSGLHSLTAPHTDRENWRTDVAGSIEVTYVGGPIFGLPQGRYGSEAATAFLDGHAEALTPTQLDDSTRWAPHARTPDENPIP